MPRIPILKLGSTSELPPPALKSYSPSLVLDGLQVGIDNLRYDVWLSPAFTKAAGAYIARLIARFGKVEAVIAAESSAPANAVRSMFSKALPGQPGKAPDFKSLLIELHNCALNRAKVEGNLALDLLARAAIIKFLRAEMSAQFSIALDRCRSTLKSYEGVRQQKAMEYREQVAAFQVGKKHILRQTGMELFRLLREIERESVASARRSLFGNESADYQVFVNLLLFSEEGRDSYLAAENYVLIGGFENDPDSVGIIRALVIEFLKLVTRDAEEADRTSVDAWLSAPENAHELVGTGEPSEKACHQRLQQWVELLQRDKIMDLALAAYEVLPLLGEFTPLLDPQQLKYALAGRAERERLEKLIEEHGKLSLKNFNNAFARVAEASTTQKCKIAARFMRDFLCYYRDLRRLEALNAATEQINLIGSEKLRDLSRLNGTLYSFILEDEAKVQDREKKVARHVILKADVRDSSRLTRSLLERGMNPASYFSLNFYDPVNKLLAKYNASKVFVEGDAIILAIMENEDEPKLAVSRACVLAREMMEIVGGYNHLLQRAGLPSLELGIGISFQDSAPMYLLDGERRIMISDALNESDRLSSCDKKMRKAMKGMQAPFNIYEFRAQTAESEPMRYNVGGIRLSEPAFSQLKVEVSLQSRSLEFPRLWGTEEPLFHSALVPVRTDVFRRIVVRESHVPVVGADFALSAWTGSKLFEVCTSTLIYDAVEKKSAAGS